jgi:hypothetical protein
MVKVPPIAGAQGRGHRRSQSLTANSGMGGKTWSPGSGRERERKLSGLRAAMGMGAAAAAAAGAGEMGEKEKLPSSPTPPTPAQLAVPPKTKPPSPPGSPSQHQQHQSQSHAHTQPPTSPTLIRRFGSIFAGEGTHGKNRRLSLFSGGTKELDEHGIHGLPSGTERERDAGEVDRAETDVETVKARDRERKIHIVDSEKREKTGGNLSHSASQPLSGSAMHRRAATVVAPRHGTAHGHERRTSAIVNFGRSATVKRPSTATDSSFPTSRFAVKGGEAGEERQRERLEEEEDLQRESATDKEDETFKPIYMKGLFR